ncbi:MULTISPECIES: AmpG family muropeptide MFS transporter [unclassified Gilliamella]|uniref:AmpG family muropeptide MFS transporter n=1 Tax=unclassified Gilliamella TaxID=2685620 RepID=UPI001C6A077E|nr:MULTISPECIES: AmpG family muropeptide MFS transporter [unclassified Gilliamella]MCX8580338.1 AmpG family muropeptide MFS transporter [Gilliamella sp. B3482]MCX8584973.1 AmpG family muropeptide MFS transporter [Gilliamella sp. B3562]MCX8659976.1 AmpG family muropeptide MFS transporter [Gilliamella sp. B2772]MCX8661897.1 AmpG family muropeptide MFS transporter [Gilliamella sp. B2911]MCX8670091.1 AmpG family muropeptide MFS transporter [Gilliamella sp. B2785]
MNKKQVSLLRTIFSTKMLICIFTGLASGLPFYLLIQLLPAWLTSEGLNIKAIGAFSLTQLPYIFKFVWAPFMDNISLFGMGRRRGWMFLSQIILLFFIAILGCFSPTLNIWIIATLCFIIALFSATQDIALDAFRQEILSDTELGLGNSIHINVYRLASLVPGSLSLILSHFLPWSSVFMVTALFMLPVIIITLLIKEPINKPIPKSHNFEDIIINPFLEFIKRKGVKSAMIILAFIFLYKLGDSMATSLATTFYMKMGFSLPDIGLIAKNAQLWPGILGGIMGGILMIKIGINRALWYFGFVQVFSILGFAWLSIEGPFNDIGVSEKIMLAIVISVESLGVGLGSAAFVAFIAKTTNPLYTATQFALFSSIASIPRTLINSTTGIMVEYLGWTNFFGLCTLLAIPGMVLLLKVAPWNKKS